MGDNEANRRSFLQRNLLIIILVMMLASIPLQSFLGRTTDLLPDRSDAVMMSAFVTGIVTGVAFALLVAFVKPASRSSTTVTATGFFFCGAMLGTSLGMALADAAFQAIDFSGRNVTRKLEDLAIARAYRTHGKGGCDHIQLRDYFGDFCINRREYKAIFGDREDTQPEGYCLRVDTERNGSAIRVMHSSTWAFRPGAVVRCANVSR